MISKVSSHQTVFYTCYTNMETSYERSQLITIFLRDAPHLYDVFGMVLKDKVAKCKLTIFTYNYRFWRKEAGTEMGSGWSWSQEKIRKIHGKFLGGFAVEKSLFTPIFEP